MLHEIPPGTLGIGDPRERLINTVAYLQSAPATLSDIRINTVVTENHRWLFLLGDPGVGQRCHWDGLLLGARLWG